MKFPKFLEKAERRYIFWTSLFFLIYFIFVIPWASSYFSSSNYLTQFFWFNLMVVIFLQIFLKSVATGKRLPALKGFLGILFLIMAISVISPPLSILKSGAPAVNDGLGSWMVPASADFTVGQLWLSLGIKGGITFPNFLPLIGGQFYGFIYLLTYIFSPILLLIISSKFLNDFVQAV